MNGEGMGFSVRQLFYALASFFAITFLLYFGRPVVVPLAFALLISLILYPVAKFFEKHGSSRIWSTLWTIVAVTVVILGITYLFSAQIIRILREFDDFKMKLNDVLASVVTFLNEKVSLMPTIEEEDVKDFGRKWFSGQSRGILANTLNSTALFITNLVLTIIYTFLILLYRGGLKKAFTKFASPDKREYYSNMINRMQHVGQQYLSGMFILILILGVLNSLGLFLIGIDYPLFFGFLAAFLAIVPYVGTTLGGAIPTIYAFMIYDSYWYPLGVILLFWFIQIVEGNFLNPKIVGGNLNLNALVAILALISGGLIWGIPGMILFLPYMAIFKVACEHYNELKPISYILRDDLYKDNNEIPVTKRIKKIFKK